jgi:hypothetical protein
MFLDDFFSPFKIDDFYPLTMLPSPLLLMFSVSAMAFLLLPLSLLLLASI